MSNASLVKRGDNGYITGMTVNSETTVRKIISLSRDLARAIDDYRFKHRLKTEAETIRQLIERGLDAERKKSRRA